MVTQVGSAAWVVMPEFSMLGQWLDRRAALFCAQAWVSEAPGYESLVRSSAVIQPSSDAIRIPVPGMCKGSVTSRSAWQNGPSPAAWMAGTEGPAVASAEPRAWHLATR